MMMGLRVGRVLPVAAISTMVLSGQEKESRSEGNDMMMAVAAGAVALGYGAYRGMSQMQSLDERLGALEIKAAKTESSAFVFIKPHAVTDPVKELVKKKLGDVGISITAEGTIPGPVIDKEMYIDSHYGAIAEKAVKLKPEQLAPSAKAKAEFEKTFGMPWAEALKKGLVYNAMDGCAKLGLDGDGLDQKWSELKRGVTLIKFGGGFYCGKVGDIYIINGFYMSMRSKFTKPGTEIHYYLVEWPTASLSWEAFRNKVLGGTNPYEAETGSLRKIVAQEWQALGLSEPPNTGDNGVHASASPFEALAERMNWCGIATDADTFGKGLLAAGVPLSTILKWTSDPQVKLADGSKGSLFDALEDSDSDVCLAKATELAKLNK